MESSNLNQPKILPLLSLNGGDDDFNYTSFFPDEDISYLINDDPSGSTSTLNDDPGILGVSSPTTALARSNSNQRHRLERRGHTKSRRGCFNCKRRRIKCQETRPACGHCVKTGLKCEYPAVPQVVHQPQHQIPLFSLQDMRFFQHFLLSCFPHHPLGNESIWTHEIPCLSQTYEYLMHAILGLAASDLMAQDPSLVTFAMAHRLKAIKAIKKTLNQVPKSKGFEEGNALVATCFALTFQSVVLDDGMAEFMTFCRGIVIVAIQMWCKGAKFIFSNLEGNGSTTLLRPFIEALPPIRRDWVDGAVAGVRALEPLCADLPVETEYYRYLQEMTEALYTSAYRAYEILCQHYGWWIQMPHDQFQRLVDPENQVATLLASHWIAIKQVMAPITETEQHVRTQQPARREEGSMDLGMGRWLKYLNRQVDAEHRQYNGWPMWVEEQLDRDLGFFGKTMH
ncbi:hypothetical protein GGS26DRAFT_552937 [Hypomontagnella submonticulosa]|nr:hypothetical protein GGS26DRAFT_552937 [Hypomontagnella submonticulosa]